MPDQLAMFKRLIEQSEECLQQARTAQDADWAKVWVHIAEEYRQLAHLAEKERL